MKLLLPSHSSRGDRRSGILTPRATLCDGVAALGTGCYSQNLRQRVKIVERQVVPVEKIVIEKQYVPAERIIQRQKVVIERQRDYPLRSSLRASARVVERLAAPRAKVIQRQRIVERTVY